MKITPISMISLCILFLVVAMVLFWNVPSRDIEGFLPEYIKPSTVKSLLLPRSDVDLNDGEIVLYSRAEKRLALTVVEYDMYLRISAIRKDNDGNTIVKVWRPYDLLSSNARIFPRFQLSFLIPSTSVVEETTELMVSDEGARHINIYKGVTGMVKAWGLKTLIPPSDLILHDACKAVSQNVFTTTEIAKFQNVQGCTLRYTVRDPDFVVAFCVKRNNGAPQFVGMRTNGNNLQIGAYDMYNGEKYDARKALDTGVATMAKYASPRNESLSNNVILFDALSTRINTIAMEVLPGQLRVMLQGGDVKKAYAFNMPEILRNTSALKTDLAWPCQVAWRASSGNMSLFTFPMCDLAM
jgi:hypothetical protein